MRGPISIQQRLGAAVVVALLVLYVAVHLYFSQYYSLVPDENWFLAEANLQARTNGNDTPRIVFGQANYLGYGALYWIAYILMVREIGPADAFSVLRVSVAVSTALLAVLLVLLVRDRGPSFQTSALLLWATMPIAWWSGKVTGPEIFSLLFLAGGCYLAFRPERTGDGFGWHHLLLGISTGLKVNALPVALGVLFWDRLRIEGKGRMALFGFLSLAGFVAVNPFIVSHPAVYLAHLRSVSEPLFSGAFTVTGLLDHLRTIAWNFLYEWDLVFVGGYFQWGLSAGAWAVLWWMLRKQKVPAGMLAVFVVVSLLSAGLVIMNKRYVGWYWFPLILFQLFLIVRLPVNARALVALAMLNILFNAQVIYHTIQIRKEANDNLLAFPAVKNCVDEYLAGMPADLVVDRMEVGLWKDTVTLPTDHQKQPPLIHYLLGDRLMRFSSYRRTFGDLLDEPNFRCGYVTIVTVAEPFDRYLLRLADRNKRSVLQ
jgi:hypothetical protein